MDTTISVTDLRRRFKLIFDRVARQKQNMILTRGNQPEAALIPYEDFVRLQKLKEDEVWKQFDAMLEKMARLNAKYTDEEVMADLEAIDAEKRR